MYEIEIQDGNGGITENFVYTSPLKTAVLQCYYETEGVVCVTTFSSMHYFFFASTLDGVERMNPFKSSSIAKWTIGGQGGE